MQPTAVAEEKRQLIEEDKMQHRTRSAQHAPQTRHVPVVSTTRLNQRIAASHMRSPSVWFAGGGGGGSGGGEGAAEGRGGGREGAAAQRARGSGQETARRGGTFARHARMQAHAHACMVALAGARARAR
jgi:hypothetical protein